MNSIQKSIQEIIFEDDEEHNTTVNEIEKESPAHIVQKKSTRLGGHHKSMSKLLFEEWSNAKLSIFDRKEDD